MIDEAIKPPKQAFGIILASWVEGQFISANDPFLLEVDSGGGFVTVPDTEYVLHHRTGEIVKRDFDNDTGTEFDWDEDDDWQCTYTLIDEVTLDEDTFTEEAQDLIDLDEYVPMSPEGEIDASAPDKLIVQKIHAGSGYIGKWTITRQYLVRDTGVNGTSSGMAPLDYPFFAGATYANRATAPFRVTPAGDAHFSGSIDVGGTITVTGSIKSDDFVAGVSGWRVKGTTSDAEFHNIIARGSIRAMVFEVGEVQTIGGTWMIAKNSAKLDLDMAVPGAGTWVMTVKDPPGATWLFANGDYGVIKASQGGVSETYFTVVRIAQTGGQQTYTCTFASGTRPKTYEKGNAVVNLGTTGQGYLLMSADATGAPFYSVRTWVTNPYTPANVTVRGHLGNLNGIAGVSSNYYGLFAGDYAGGNFIRYDQNGGLEIQAGSGGVKLNADGMALYDGANNIVFYNSSDDAYGGIYFTSGSGDNLLFINVFPDPGDLTNTAGLITLSALNDSAADVRLALNSQVLFQEARLTANAVYLRIMDSSTTGEWIHLNSQLNGLGTFASAPTKLLHLRNAAPEMLFEDTTGSAKSLLIVVDSNKAIFEELAGADVLVLDLANARVGVANASPTVALDVTGAGLFSGALTTQGAFTSIGIDDNSNAVAMTIDSTERVLIGDTSTENYGGGNYMLQITSATASAAAIGGISILQTSADTRAPDVWLGKSRNATIGSFTIVNSGDTMGRIIFGGDDGSSYEIGAMIRAIVDGTPGNGDMPGRLEFLTTPDATASPVLRVTLDAAGDMTFADGLDIIINTSTGTKIGTGTTQKIGFWNATPVARQSAYTQTYSTADKTHAAHTATSIAAAVPAAAPAGGTGTAAGGWDTAANRNAAITTINDLRTHAIEMDLDYEALLVDVTDLKQLVNSIIDDLQTIGLFA